MQYLANSGIFDTYWLKVSGTGLVEEFMIRNEFQQDMYAIVAGNSIKTNVSADGTIDLENLTNRRNLINLLLLTGHLTFVNKDENTSTVYEFACPNEEVRFLYERVLEERLEFNRKANGSNWFAGDRNLLVDSLLSEEVDDFRIRLDRIVIEDFRCDHTSGDRVERLYQLVMTSLFESKYFRRTTVDNDVIILEPNQKYYDSAAIVKLRVITTTINKEKVFKECMKDIENRNYAAGRIERNAYVYKIIKICLLIDGIEINRRYKVTKIRSTNDDYYPEEPVLSSIQQTDSIAKAVFVDP